VLLYIYMYFVLGVYCGKVAYRTGVRDVCFVFFGGVGGVGASLAKSIKGSHKRLQYSREVKMHCQFGRPAN
jgi:hypothetical protein